MGLLDAPPAKLGAIPLVEVVGHSYDTGDFPSTMQVRSRFTSLVASALGAAEHNIAVSGNQLWVDNTSGTNPGGWVGALNLKHPVRQDGTVRTSAPYDNPTDLAIVHHGANDLNSSTGLGATDLEPFKSAMRAVIRRFRAAALFQDSDASVTYSSSPAWNAQTAYGGMSDGTNRATPNVNATATIAVPADFPGGDIILGSIVGGIVGGVAGVVVDGSAQADWDQTTVLAQCNAHGGKVTANTYKLTGLASGAHTIVVTVKSFGTSATGWIFDYWSIQAQKPGIVLLPNQPKLPTHPSTGDYTDAKIAGFNTVLAGVAAEFTDGLVAVVDHDSALNGQASLFGSDSFHPNELGHQAMAKATLDVALPMLVRTRDRRARVRTPWHNVGEATAATFSNSWVNFGSPFEAAAYRLTRDGRVELKGAVKSGSSVTATIFTLPVGFRPLANRKFAVDSNGAFAGLQITAGGLVSVADSGSTAYVLLDGASFTAEQ